MNAIEQILDLARWAPSGDNTQVWRFEILAPNHIAIHGFDTRSHCVYDFEGHPSQMALGALLENIAIAATKHGLSCRFTRRPESDVEKPIFDVLLDPTPDIPLHSLISYIPVRSVNRRPLSTRSLTPIETRELELAVGPDYRIIWLPGWKNRWRAAVLMFKNAKLRLTMPEAYQVHSTVIQWNAQFSEERVPDGAIGLDPLSTKLMAWVMQSWQRVDFFNRYLAGTWLPRIQLDLLPGLLCAAHFVIVAKQKPETIDDFVAVGRAMQRLWLTATKEGLQIQPELTPLIFASYVRAGRRFSKLTNIWNDSVRLTTELETLISHMPENYPVFMGRIGAGKSAKSRSLRLPLDQLIIRS